MVTPARKPSALKSLYKYFKVLGIFNIAGGLPYPEYFPYDSFKAEIASPERLIDTLFHGLKLSSARSFFRHSDPKTAHLAIPKNDLSHPLSTRIDIATTGLQALADFLLEFTFDHMLQGQLAYDRDHADILLTCGSTDAFLKILGLIGSPGDNMLVEEFCYINAVQQAQPFGIGTAPVKVDDNGMMVNGPGGA